MLTRQLFTTTVRLDKALWEQFLPLIRSQGKSASYTINQLLVAYLVKHNVVTEIEAKSVLTQLKTQMRGQPGRPNQRLTKQQIKVQRRVQAMRDVGDPPHTIKSAIIAEFKLSEQDAARYL